MAHLTLYVRTRGNRVRYESLVGSFYCEEQREVFHEDDNHTLSKCKASRTEAGKDGA